jgi:phosphohistidine phosphatase SixA
MADAETIWAEAQRAKADTVLIVGHNPGLHDLAARLIEQARDRSALARGVSETMPPAAWAAFSVSGGPLAAAGARLESTWAPKSF